MGGVHRLGDLEAKAPEMVAKRQRRLPVDRRIAPGIEIPERIRDHMGGRIGDAVEGRRRLRPFDRGSRQAVVFERAVLVRQRQACHRGRSPPRKFVLKYFGSFQMASGIVFGNSPTVLSVAAHV
ncbi:hypothetical protein D9M70_581910 [compost metagenome]